MGRPVIKKVDTNGKQITNLVKWKLKHPGERFFDSKTEYQVWYYLENDRPDIEYTEQVTLKLFDSCSVEEFSAPRQTKKAKAEGRTAKDIKAGTQANIKYTPDFYLPEYDLYIEVKGWADELFKMRWKLFKLKGYKGFIVYSLDEFEQLIEKLEKDK